MTDERVFNVCISRVSFRPADAIEPGKRIRPTLEFDNFWTHQLDPLAVVHGEAVWTEENRFEYRTRYARSFERKKLLIRLETVESGWFSRSAPLGQVEVDLQTIATGPVEHTLAVRDGSKGRGEMSFSVAMEEVCFVELRLQNLQIAASHPGSLRTASLRLGVAPMSSPGKRDPPVVWASLPEDRLGSVWAYADLITSKQSFESLHQRDLCFEVYSSDAPAGGRPVAVASVPMDSFVRFGPPPPLSFRTPLRPPHGAVHVAIVGEIAGVMLLKNGPAFVQMRGGVHKDGAIFGGSLARDDVLERPSLAIVPDAASTGPAAVPALGFVPPTPASAFPGAVPGFPIPPTPVQAFTGPSVGGVGGGMGGGGGGGGGGMGGGGGAVFWTEEGPGFSSAIPTGLGYSSSAAAAAAAAAVAATSAQDRSRDIAEFGRAMFATAASGGGTALPAMSPAAAAVAAEVRAAAMAADAEEARMAAAIAAAAEAAEAAAAAAALAASERAAAALAAAEAEATARSRATASAASAAAAAPAPAPASGYGASAASRGWGSATASPSPMVHLPAPWSLRTTASGTPEFVNAMTGAREWALPTVATYEITFSIEGPIGLMLIAEPGTGLTIIDGVRPESQAAGVGVPVEEIPPLANLRRGHRLIAVNDTGATDKPFDAVVDMLAGAPRPVKLTFQDPYAVSAELAAHVHASLGM